MDLGRCAICGKPTSELIFCSRACTREHGLRGGQLIRIDGEIAERVAVFCRDVGEGYAATWERFLRVALDRAGAPL